MRLTRRISFKSLFTLFGICYCTVTTILVMRIYSCAAPKSSHDVIESEKAGVERQNAFQWALATLNYVESLHNFLPKTEIDGLRKNLQVLAKASDSLRPIYVITPTYARPVQKAELTRLCSTFMLVPNLLWIVVEDSQSHTELVANTLRNCGVTYAHLTALTNPNFKLNASDPSWLKPRGVAQRNEALRWLRSHPVPYDAVVYFADDDNTYSPQLFEEMRSTRTVTVWPVGLSGGLLYESPIVRDGHVVGFYTAWKRNRPFPLDMASFAVHMRLLTTYSNAYFSNDVARGYLESHLLSSLGVTKEQLEPRSSNCSQILVWHTRTEAPKLKNEQLARSFPANETVFIDLSS